MNNGWKAVIIFMVVFNNLIFALGAYFIASLQVDVKNLKADNEYVWKILGVSR